MDLLTQQIIQALQTNCRQSLRSLATTLGVSRQTLSKRINDLETQGIIKSYTTLFDYSKLGYPIYIMFWLKAQPAELDSVYKQLITYPKISEATLLLGPFDFLVVSIFRSTDELDDFLTQTLAKIPGIISVQSELVLSHFYKDTRIENPQSRAIEITDLDQVIINLLRNDARLAYEDLAIQAGSNIHTIRYRVKRLMDKHVIKRFVAVIDPKQLGYAISAFIRLTAHPDNVDAIYHALTHFSQTIWTDRVSNNRTIVATMNFQDRTTLLNFLETDFKKLPGIQDLQIHIALRQHSKVYI
jgi:DNA-binding Lrp family transcriptional regulator